MSKTGRYRNSIDLELPTIFGKTMAHENKFDLTREEQILKEIQHEFGYEVFTPGLDRTRPLYKKLIESFILKKIKVITVAGTNGKGQTCHTLGHYLNYHRKNVAIWTSPHILSIRERFNFNGEDISYEELEKYLFESRSMLQEFDMQISFYEYLFFVFLNWANNLNLDYIILEVGLGGRLDAVNHFDCDLAIITSISRDHQIILGNKYSQILSEKLGIARSFTPLISAFKLNYLIELTAEFCKINQIPYENIVEAQNFSESNKQLAKFAIEKLGLSSTHLPFVPKYKGREESIFWNGIEFLFIGAHNPDGMRECLDYIKQQKTDVSVVLFSFSKRDQADIDSMTRMLISKLPNFIELFATIFLHPKAINLSIFEDVLNRPGHNRINFISDWKSFLNGIKEPKNIDPQKPKNKKVLVLGSYYFIGEVQRYLFINK